MREKSSIDLEHLPAVLCEREQWVNWRTEERDGKQTKVPVDPETGGFGSATDSGTWADVETAMAAVEDGTADGVGFVFADEDPLVGVDLDDCRDPERGSVDEAAQDIIERLDSYTEVSPSGTGFHVLVKGDLPEGRNRRGSVECYDTARFFTVTGNHISSTPKRIARRQDALRDIHHDYVQDADSGSGTDDTESADGSSDGTAPDDVNLADEELLEKAIGASNGGKFERLWNGQTVGYESQSEADMALCCLLAFWTGGDQTQMDQLFRQSGLLREKWDEVHYADGSTYGEMTIERAIANTSEFYDPDSGDESTQSRASSGTSTTDAGRDESDRSHAYLTEKSRLLTDRVDELEATLEQKDERIDTLEAEIERLTEELAGRDQETDLTHEAHAVDAGADDDESETTSVWGRTKRLFGSGSK